MNNRANNFIPPMIIMRRDCAYTYTCGVDDDAQSWITPEVLRRSNALVIHDPDRCILSTFATTLCGNDYVLKPFNLSNVGSSMRYNPLVYVKDSTGVSKLAAAIISGTKGSGKPGDIDFVVCETMLLDALISYLHYETPEHEQNIKMLIEILEHMIINDYQEGDVSAVDILFEEKGNNEPWNTSVLLYDEFMDAVGGSGHAIHIAKSCIARLAPLNTPEMIDFMSRDELRLDNLTFPNTALFVIDGKAKEDIKFLVPLMYSQLYDALYQ